MKGSSITAGRFNDSKVQFLFHESTIRIADVSQEGLSRQFEDMVIVAVVHRVTDVHLIKGDPETSLVRYFGRFLTMVFFHCSSSPPFDELT